MLVLAENLVARNLDGVHETSIPVQFGDLAARTLPPARRLCVVEKGVIGPYRHHVVGKPVPFANKRLATSPEARQRRHQQ